MDRLLNSEFLYAHFWSGWRKWFAWSLCLGVILLLGGVRHATDAEFAFASLALLPVIVIAWIGGKWHGLTMATLAVVMWVAADMASDRSFSPSWIPGLNAVVRFVTYAMAVLLVSQVRLQFEREREHAIRDTLTGLHNRRAFEVAGSAELERARRYQSHLAVVFLDLDNFKMLNDALGHDRGDQALQATAKALLAATRASDVVARLGGDEFSLIFPEIGFDAAVSAGHKLFAAVNEALVVFPPVSISVGVVWFEVADRPFIDMLKAADEVMYKAKASGKNSVLWRRFPAKIDQND